MTEPTPTPWIPITPDWPPPRVRCLFCTRAGRWHVGYRFGQHWYIEGDSRVPAFMVVAVIVPDSPVKPDGE